jgi:hypothetical protein
VLPPGYRTQAMLRLENELYQYLPDLFLMKNMTKRKKKKEETG